MARRVRPLDTVIHRARNVLLCDVDRDHSESLAAGLRELGYDVQIVAAHADAFAIACSEDLDALVVAPLLRDGSALVLPSALGIRRPAVLVLATRLSDHFSTTAAKRVGFDTALTKVVMPEAVDRLVRRAAQRRAMGVRTTSAPRHVPH